MSFETDLKTVGFKDMHDDQTEAFVTMVNALLHLADGYENEDVFKEAHQIAEDAVVLFGGNGIDVMYEPAV
jgi:hypothetical protein